MPILAAVFVTFRFEPEFFASSRCCRYLSMCRPEGISQGLGSSGRGNPCDHGVHVIGRRLRKCEFRRQQHCLSRFLIGLELAAKQGRKKRIDGRPGGTGSSGITLAADRSA